MLPYTHVQTTDHPLVHTTCTYPTTLQSTALSTPAVATSSPSPPGTLHLVLPVDFMQVDPATNSLPLMLKCFTKHKPCIDRSRLPIQSAIYKYPIFISRSTLTYRALYYGKIETQTSYIYIYICLDLIKGTSRNF